MLTGFLVELLVTVMVLSALLITCAVLLGAGMPSKPGHTRTSPNGDDRPRPFVG
ncbi:hypothetical protein [Parasphingorhabdus pacifica]